MSANVSTEELTLLEVGGIEEELDATLDDALRGPRRARALGLVALAHERRTNPAAELEDVMSRITLADFTDSGPGPT